MTKLNLGCGFKRLDGYINVDKEAVSLADVHYDLEVFPWPWPDDSVSDIVAHHCLEHLGASTLTWLGIMKEIFRVCRPGATVSIVVPHHRHDHFANDCTHVRAITAEGLRLFDQQNNIRCIENDFSNTPLGLTHGVDFEIVQVKNSLEEPWAGLFMRHAISEKELQEAALQRNNVITEVQIDFRVIKPGRGSTWLKNRPLPKT